MTIAVLTFGCSNQDNNKSLNKDSLQVNHIDTTKNSIDVLNENTHYIGFVDYFYFSKTNEAYIELYFLTDEILTEEYLQLGKLADSLIYEDVENSRHRFPAGLSQKHFDLRGLSKIAICDDNNKFVCDGNFVRVEYFDQNISPGFIAVYRTGKKIESDNYYCISNFDKNPETTNYSITKDTLLTQKILDRLNVLKPYFGLKNNGTHIHFENSDTIISVVNSSNSVYIVLVSGEKFTVLYKSPNPENFIKLQVVPLMKNKFPYILTRNAKPETDVIWDKLLYFNGTNYVNTNRQRIE